MSILPELRMISTRVTVFVQRFPLPSWHGGLVDSLGIIRALRRLGADVQVVYFTGAKDQPTPAAIAELRNEVDDLVSLNRYAGWKRALKPLVPPMASSHILDRAQRQELQAKLEAFRTEWVLLDSWPAALTATEMARALALPLVYRSQNVEKEYLFDCARRARGRERLRLLANAVPMLHFERRLRRTAKYVWDIVEDDTAYWRAEGTAGNALTVPPVWQESQERLVPLDVEWDTVFVGNLRTPNNVEGVLWFCTDVMPLLTAGLGRKPRVLIAGSSPSEDFVKRCTSMGASVVSNPAETASLYSRSRVAINPVRMSAGFNMKMLELIGSRLCIVSTPAAMRGLPNDTRECVVVAESASDFAAGILRWLTYPASELDLDRAARRLDVHFGDERLAETIRQTLSSSKGK